MTTLTLSTLTMPAATLGGENPLAPLRAYETASAAGANAGEAAGDYPDRGREDSILPYRLQDQYDRRRQNRSFKTAVLENENVRATFLLELGGRLWSLIDKRTDRELLFVNPVFQPANLAVRDAWFSGGVEWNVSIIGHSAFTAAPLFAARVQADDGSPILRLYEWDRIRRVPFQIDFWLPSDRPFLMVAVRITNPNDHIVPMYWWSNIAVPERRDVRVIGPADLAYRHDYDGTLVEHQVPMYEGADVTYTTNRRYAADLYFRIPSENRKWIAALDGGGRGLVQTSTDRLLGRKMFNWGTDSGGQRWQEFLAEPGQAYIEIQGGLAQTQGEYVAMPAHAQWSWVEAYGLLEADAEQVHDRNWPTARGAVERELERTLPRRLLDEDLSRWNRTIADRAPAEVLHHGSGWGALEQLRRARANEPPFASHALPFPQESIGQEQAAWLTLLNDRMLPHRATTDDPGSLMVQPEWRDMLEKSVVNEPAAAHWLAWYHLGVMRYRAGDRGGAKEAWITSIAACASPWATRNWAVAVAEEGDSNGAAELWLVAARSARLCVPLAIECARSLLVANRPADMVSFVDELPATVKKHGRIRLLRAMASLALGDLDAVGRYFDGDVDIANIREKETSLSDLWFGWHQRRLARDRGVQIDDALRQEVRQKFPPPPRFDFRLNVELA